MRIERQMFAVIQQHCNGVTHKKNTSQISSIKTVGLMNAVHNTSRFVVMTGNTAFLSSEILSLSNEF
jgi:alanyl-tRNA synthetase